METSTYKGHLFVPGRSLKSNEILFLCVKCAECYPAAGGIPLCPQADKSNPFIPASSFYFNPKPEPVNCTKCNKPLDDPSETFCGNCREPISRVQSSQDLPPLETSNPHPKECVRCKIGIAPVGPDCCLTCMCEFSSSCYEPRMDTSKYCENHACETKECNLPKLPNEKFCGMHLVSKVISMGGSLINCTRCKKPIDNPSETYCEHCEESISKVQSNRNGLTGPASTRNCERCKIDIPMVGPDCCINCMCGFSSSCYEPRVGTSAYCRNHKKISTPHNQDCGRCLNDCTGAACGGHLKCLKSLHENGRPWDKWTCARAAKSGSLDCLKYAHENGCPWDEWTPRLAASRGRLECLKYAHENGCPWDETTFEEAVQNVHFDCARYAYDNKCPGFEKFTVKDETWVLCSDPIQWKTHDPCATKIEEPVQPETPPTQCTLRKFDPNDPKNVALEKSWECEKEGCSHRKQGKSGYCIQHETSEKKTSEPVDTTSERHFKCQEEVHIEDQTKGLCNIVKCSKQSFQGRRYCASHTCKSIDCFEAVMVGHYLCLKHHSKDINYTCDYDAGYCYETPLENSGFCKAHDPCATKIEEPVQTETPKVCKTSSSVPSSPEKCSLVGCTGPALIGFSKCGNHKCSKEGCGETSVTSQLCTDHVREHLGKCASPRCKGQRYMKSAYCEKCVCLTTDCDIRRSCGFKHCEKHVAEFVSSIRNEEYLSPARESLIGPQPVVGACSWGEIEILPTKPKPKCSVDICKEECMGDLTFCESHAKRNGMLCNVGACMKLRQIQDRCIEHDVKLCRINECENRAICDYGSCTDHLYKCPRQMIKGLHTFVAHPDLQCNFCRPVYCAHLFCGEKPEVFDIICKSGYCKAHAVFISGTGPDQKTQTKVCPTPSLDLIEKIVIPKCNYCRVNMNMNNSALKIVGNGLEVDLDFVCRNKACSTPCLCPKSFQIVDLFADTE